MALHAIIISMSLVSLGCKNEALKNGPWDHKFYLVISGFFVISGYKNKET